MAQSYGTLTTQNITAATDGVMGTSSAAQKLGTSYSAAVTTAVVIAGGNTIAIKLDADTAPQTITLAANTNFYAIATDIQTKVRALSPVDNAAAGAFASFTARWDTSLNKFILTSGTADTTPAVAAVVVTGASAAATLKLGATYGGTESKTGALVTSYTVRYRFVYDAGKHFGVEDINVMSTEMSDPTSVSEANSLATTKAAMIKTQQSSIYALYP